MPVFQANRFRAPTKTTSFGDRIGAIYRANLSKHPFLLFGLPFIAIMVAGSFFLTPATALRYERHDRKVHQLSRQEEMGLGLKGVEGNVEGGIKRNPRRRILGSEKEEYYVCNFR
jgi:cytochrome c oxidase assembly protein subunit 16